MSSHSAHTMLKRRIVIYRKQHWFFTMRMEKSPGLMQRLMQGSLVTQIMIGLIAGIALAWFSKAGAHLSACWVRCLSAR